MARPRPHTLNPEDETRIDEALAAPIEDRAPLPRIDVASVLRDAKPSGLKPIAKGRKRVWRDD